MPIKSFFASSPAHLPTGWLPWQHNSPITTTRVRTAPGQWKHECRLSWWRKLLAHSSCKTKSKTISQSLTKIFNCEDNKQSTLNPEQTCTVDLRGLNFWCCPSKLDSWSRRVHRAWAVDSPSGVASSSYNTAKPIHQCMHVTLFLKMLGAGMIKWIGSWILIRLRTTNWVFKNMKREFFFEMNKNQQIEFQLSTSL